MLKKYVAVGSIIHSDCWKGYANLDQQGYTHFTVNHSKNFVDPESGAHPNSIEGMWQKMKYGCHMPQFRNVKDAHLPGYLATFMWKEGHSGSDLFVQFLKDAARIYSGVCTSEKCTHCHH